jgi:hypothetical protein
MREVAGNGGKLRDDATKARAREEDAARKENESGGRSQGR